MEKRETIMEWLEKFHPEIAKLWKEWKKEKRKIYSREFMRNTYYKKPTP